MVLIVRTQVEAKANANTIPLPASPLKGEEYGAPAPCAISTHVSSGAFERRRVHGPRSSVTPPARRWHVPFGTAIHSR
jgi:hypothetical protein